MPYSKYGPQILEAINNSDHILLVSHPNPDGDTLGASLAISDFLDNNNKKHRHYCPDKPAQYFNFLPKIENLISDYQEINLTDHDVIITIDCGDIKRTGIAEDLNKYREQLIIINIDHHESNDHFGNHNLVIPQASSTSEIVYKFFEFHNIPLNKNMATNLLTGIMTDTMNFTNAATNQESLKISSELLDKGAKINTITAKLRQNKNMVALKLWGKVLSRLEYNKKYNFAYTVITKKDLSGFDITREAIDGLANFLSNLEEASFIMVLAEEDDNIIKGSLRTTKDTVNVAKLAEKLGGGGHQKAAGFKINGQLKKTQNGWQII